MAPFLVVLFGLTSLIDPAHPSELAKVRPGLDLEVLTGEKWTEDETCPTIHLILNGKNTPEAYLRFWGQLNTQLNPVVFLSNSLSVVINQKNRRHGLVLKHVFVCETFLISTPEEYLGEESPTINDKLLQMGHSARDLYVFVFPSAQNSAQTALLNTLQDLKWKFYTNLDEYSARNIQFTPDTLKNSRINSRNGEEAIWIHRRKINLGGVFQKVSGIVLPPYMILNKERTKIIGGTFCIVFQVAAEHYNFTYDMSTDPKPTGALLPNGTWTGMMGDVYHGKKDVGMCIHAIQPRWGHLDFTTYMFNERAFFLMAHPETRVKWDALISPFTPTLWLWFISAFAGMTLALLGSFVAGNFFAAHLYRAREKETTEVKYQAFMIPFAHALDQGATVPQRGKFLVILWLIFILVLSTGYKDKLMAFLTFPEPEPIPRNLEEVHQRPDFKMIFHFWGSTMLARFKNKHNAMMLSLGKRLHLEKNPAICVVNATIQQRTLCIGVRSFLSVAMAKNVTLSTSFQSYELSEELFFPIYLSFPLRRNSIYTAAYEEIAGRYRESGLIPKWNKDVFNGYKKEGRTYMLGQKESTVYKTIDGYINSLDNTEKPLVLKHFYVVIAIYFLFHALCGPIFLWEISKTIFNRSSSDRLHQYFNNHKPHFEQRDDDALRFQYCSLFRKENFKFFTLCMEHIGSRLHKKLTGRIDSDKL